MQISTTGLRWQLGLAADTTARLYFSAPAESDIVQIAGHLRGPSSALARTLPASYAVQPLSRAAGQPCLAEVVLPDPCYWTPQSPFLYDVQLELTAADHTTDRLETCLGLRRWAVEGNHVSWERRRYVLRGVGADAPTADVIAAARVAELALLVAQPEAALCQEASRWGVPLVVDLRGLTCSNSGGWGYDWAAAVLVVLAEPAQVALWQRQPHNFLLATCLTPQTPAAAVAGVDGDLWAVEIGPGETPPTWLASATKPVLVMRGQADRAPGEFSRRACDRLQQELAPAFDLAGYFVIPGDMP